MKSDMYAGKSPTEFITPQMVRPEGTMMAILFDNLKNTDHSTQSVIPSACP